MADKLKGLTDRELLIRIYRIVKWTLIILLIWMFFNSALSEALIKWGYHFGGVEGF